MITRPGVEEILAYRRHVTEAMAELIEQDRGDWHAICSSSGCITSSSIRS